MKFLLPVLKRFEDPDKVRKDSAVAVVYATTWALYTVLLLLLAYRVSVSVAKASGKVARRDWNLFYMLYERTLNSALTKVDKAFSGES